MNFSNLLEGLLILQKYAKGNENVQMRGGEYEAWFVIESEVSEEDKVKLYNLYWNHGPYSSNKETDWYFV